jgi:hypothetical protein
MSALPNNSALPRDGVPAASFTKSEREAAAQIARRLCVEFRGLVSLLPKPLRSASAMSRALGVDRNTCQRIVSSTAIELTDERLLVRLPGVQGLRQFIEALKRDHSDGRSVDQLDAAAAAVDAFESLVQRLGGSQRRLRQRLEADPDLDSGTIRIPSDELDARRSLFKAAAEVVGRWSDLMVSMSLIRPVPGYPLLTDCVRAQARLGHVWRGSAVPFEINASAPDHLALNSARGFSGEESGIHQSLASRPARGDTPDLLLPQFCTRPLPRVTSRSWGNRGLHVIDAAEPTNGEPIDVVVGYRRSTPDKHPATQDPPIGEVSTLTTYPSRRLICDVYLHRDIAKMCSPSLEAHLGSPSLPSPLRARWSTRFPGGPRLELLGAGLHNTATPAYSRQLELTSHVFSEVGWDPEEFIGYRCDVVFPIWQAAYCLLFDFSEHTMTEGQSTPAPTTHADSPSKRAAKKAR